MKSACVGVLSIIVWKHIDLLVDYTILQKVCTRLTLKKSKYSLKINMLELLKRIIYFCFEIFTKHLTGLCGRMQIILMLMC